MQQLKDTITFVSKPNLMSGD